MAEYDNTNRGVLFKNEDKQQETHADYNGTINVGGQEFWLNAWIKTGKKGKFMSLSVKAKSGKPKPESRPSGFEDMESDIPFDQPYRSNWRIV